MSLLQAKLLGEFSLTCDNQPLIGMTTGRSQALLAYLILHPHAPQPRQRIAFHLWTESTDAQARTNLRKELSYLRRDLPNADQFLLVEAKTLQWSPTAPFTLDVFEFEEAIKAAQTADSDRARSLLEQAIHLYRGDLLPSCEDEWILPERERLQQVRVSALEQLIDRLKEQRDYRTAIAHAQQLLRIDPLSEATYTSLMQLHGLNGDRSAALQTYHRCMSVLREELGVDPSATTRKVYEQLLLQDEALEDELHDERLEQKTSTQLPMHLHPLPPPSRLASPLVGRQQEWQIIQNWVNVNASDAASTVLLLVGESGIGKTRLLEELREAIPVVLWGRGFAAEMVRPYGIWIDALRSVVLPQAVNISPELGFLLPEIGQPVKAPPDRSHLFDAVVQLLAEWATQSPIVVMLDDIQWVDEASTALLHYASRLLSHLPVKFACTARSGELTENAAISRVVQALRREQRLTTLELQPFDRGRTAELIRSVITDRESALSLEVVDRVFVDSGGNPLFVLEVARALPTRGRSLDQSVPVDNLEALISDRLQQLDPSAREFLPWAAALGRSFKPTTVAQVADYPLPQLLTAIEQLERQSIIRPSTSVGNETGYDFAHDIVRQVVYQQFSEPRRQLIHLQIAHKLKQLSTPDNAMAGDIAHHAWLGGDPLLAASSALLAAERCLKLFAYADAATLAQRGLEQSQSLDPQTRIHLQLSLLRVWILSGVTGDRAIELEAHVHQLMNEASQLGLKDEEAIGLEALGVLYFNQSNFTDVHHHSLRAVEVGRAASPATAARLLAFSGSCLAELGQDMIRAEALLLEAQSLANRVSLEFCDIPSGLGSIQLHNGRYHEARSLLQQSWRLAQVEQDHWREYNCLSYLVMTELEAGDAIAALAYCKEMATIAAKIEGESSESIITEALIALANYQLQQPDSEVVLEQSITSLEQVDAKRVLAYLLIGSAEVDLECGRFQVAMVRAEAALQAAQTIGHPSETILAWALLVQSVLAMGDLARARTEFKALQQHINRRTLSSRAQIAVDRIIQQMQAIPSTASTHRKSIIKNA
jgi:DNA-binding SARP family transcriptional activator/predicted ATPase